MGGTCAKIAEHIEKRLRLRGFAFDVESTPSTRPMSLDDYAAVIIIAAVYHQHHPASIERFVRLHTHGLSHRPTAFISVSLGRSGPTPLHPRRHPSDTTRRHERTRWDDVDDVVDAMVEEIETTRALHSHAMFA